MRRGFPLNTEMDLAAKPYQHRCTLHCNLAPKCPRDVVASEM